MRNLSILFLQFAKVFVICCFVVTFLGCSSISIELVEVEKKWEESQSSIIVNNTLSLRSQQLLRSLFLKEELVQNPHGTIHLLHERFKRNSNPDLLFTLAEICYQRGQISGNNVPYYIWAMKYAYLYLFPKQDNTALFLAYDPHFRTACDIYNFSLYNCILLGQKPPAHEEKMELEVYGWQVKRRGFLIPDEDFSYFLLAQNFYAKGIRNQHRRYGLGVPIIIVRDKKTGEGMEKYYLKEAQGFPGTLFARMDMDVNSLDFHSARGIELELYDPKRFSYVKVKKRKVPLEADFTTAALYFSRRDDPIYRPIVGLFNVTEEEYRMGVVMFTPYEKGKIPVVLTHGLASSPSTWMEMFHDFESDPRLSSRYHFSLYGYPTGNSILYSASQMREALYEFVQTIDPKGTDPAIQNMVLVGHSMGGVLSRLMVQDSGENMWNTVIGIPLDNVPLDEKERKMVDDAFNFDPLPFVKRAIFIAAPHRGSDFSNWGIVKILEKFITLPQTVASFYTKFQDFVLSNFPLIEWDEDTLPTSLSSLSPSNKSMVEMLKHPIEVQYHSIIGNVEPGALKEGSDGVVPYTSSHLDGALSEYIVPEGHSCTSHPLTIEEVRRILLQHLEEVDQEKEEQQ